MALTDRKPSRPWEIAFGAPAPRSRRAAGALWPTWYGGSHRASRVMAWSRTAARRASPAPDDPPGTAAWPPASAMTAARSSISRSTAYGLVSPRTGRRR
ncbi:MAG TPA: hypothetical protein VFV73_13765 [Streptosporangiaceae bacterium]|nr:hypothetical protein [Streptosporangiaceae bacterium]